MAEKKRYYSYSEFARLCDRAPGAITNQITKGYIIPTANRRIDIESPSAKEYLRKCKTQKNKRAEKSNKTELEIEKLKVDIETKKLNLEIQRGDLIKRETVEGYLIKIGEIIRTQILPLHETLSEDLALQTDPIKINKILKTKIYRACNQMGRTIEKYLEED